MRRGRLLITVLVTLGLLMVKSAGPVSAGGGSVSFASPSSLLVGSGPQSVAVGDLNGDGKADLVTANNGDNNVSVRLGNGDGTFGPPITSAVGQHPTAVAIGDLNRDGHPDLAVTIGSNFVYVLLGNGDGTFYSGNVAPNTTGYPTGYVNGGTTSIAVGDLNGDGKLDVATSIAYNNEGGLVSVLLGKGDGSFGSPTTYTIAATPTSVAIGDLNRDGKSDLVTSTQDINGNSTVSVLLGTGNGTFGAVTTYTVGSYAASVAIGDLNGDGRLDLVTANSGDTTVSVLLGNGDGTFGPQTTSTVIPSGGQQPYSVAIGDLNGDGKPDLVTSNYTDFFNPTDGSVSVVLGNGDGTFGPPTTLAVDAGPHAVAISDLNRDGHLDLVTVNATANTVSVLLQTASPTTPPTATDQTITFGSLGNKTYGDTPPTLDATASSGLPVSFSSETGGVCTATGTNGTTITIQAAGTCTIDANQAGNSDYNPAPSVSRSFDIAKETLTVTPKNGQSMVYGSTSVPTIEYTITGFVNNENSGVLTAQPSCSTSAGAYDSTTSPATTGSPAGTYPITCSGGAGANYTFSHTTGVTFEITPAPLSVTVTHAAVTYGEPAPASSSFSAAYSGIVNGDQQSAVVGTTAPNCTTTYTASPPSGSGPYPITCTIGSLSAPNYTFVSGFNDTNNGLPLPGSAPGFQLGTLTVNQAASSVTINNLPSSVTVGASFTPTYTVVGDGTPATASNTTSTCTVDPMSGLVRFIAAGACQLQASISGGTNYADASGSVQSVSIGKADTTSSAVTSSANPSVYGQSVTFSVTVSSAAGTPTGSVTFKDGGTTIGIGSLNGSGVATLTIPASSPLAVGSHTITATYGGDNNFNSSNAAGVSQTVNKVSSTVALTSSSNPSLLNGPVTLSATVAAAGTSMATPTGTVTFKDGKTTLGTGTLNGSGVATLTTSSLAVGSHTITASYGGATSFGTSSGSTTQMVDYGVGVLSTTSLNVVLQVLDYNGVNDSASKLAVTAKCVVSYSSTVPTSCGSSPVQSIKRGSFSFLKSYQSAGAAYQYQVSSTGLTTGTQYDLLVQIGSDPTLHAVPFTD